MHPVPLAQAPEKWPDLAFALEFACASLSCEENLWFASQFPLMGWFLRSSWGRKFVLEAQLN